MAKLCAAKTPVTAALEKLSLETMCAAPGCFLTSRHSTPKIALAAPNLIAAACTPKFLEPPASSGFSSRMSQELPASRAWAAATAATLNCHLR